MKTVRLIAYDSNNSIMEIIEFIENRKTSGLRRKIKATMKRCSYFGKYPFKRIAVKVVHN